MKRVFTVNIRILTLRLLCLNSNANTKIGLAQLQSQFIGKAINWLSKEWIISVGVTASSIFPDNYRTPEK